MERLATISLFRRRHLRKVPWEGLRCAIICIFNLCKWMLAPNPHTTCLADGDSGSRCLLSLAALTAHQNAWNPELMFRRPRIQVWLSFQLAM